MINHKWDNCVLDVGLCICGDPRCVPDTNTKAVSVGMCRQMTKEERVAYYSYDNMICKAQEDILHYGTQIERLALLEGLKLMRDELRAKIESDCKQ